MKISRMVIGTVLMFFSLASQGETEKTEPQEIHFPDYTVKFASQNDYGKIWDSCTELRTGFRSVIVDGKIILDYFRFVGNRDLGDKRRESLQDDPSAEYQYKNNSLHMKKKVKNQKNEEFAFLEGDYHFSNSGIDCKMSLTFTKDFKLWGNFSENIVFPRDNVVKCGLILNNGHQEKTSIFPIKPTKENWSGNGGYKKISIALEKYDFTIETKDPGTSLCLNYATDEKLATHSFCKHPYLEIFPQRRFIDCKAGNKILWNYTITIRKK